MYLGFKVHCYGYRGGEGNDGSDRDGNNDSKSGAEDVGKQEGFVHGNRITYY